MQLVKLRLINSSTRHSKLLKKNLLLKNTKFFKNLKLHFKKRYGRSSSTGHITSWHKQQGAKKLYRPISTELYSKCIIIGISYDPNKNSFSSINFNFASKVFFNETSLKSYHPGIMLNRTSNLAELYNGSRLRLENIPVGTLISNISDFLSNTMRSKYTKSAGVCSQLIHKYGDVVEIKLPSKETKFFSAKSLATIGIVSNELYQKQIIGKAGRNRNLGRRPIVRGIAMNPVDHPHGGRTNGGMPSVTPWGLPTKNFYKGKIRMWKKLAKKKNYV